MKNQSSVRELLKKYLFIIYNEIYTNPTNKNFIERYVAKHPLLKPELIVVNDQLHGFKKISKKAMSLEEFPIYLEIEGIYEKKNILTVDSIEIYSETQINCQDKLTEIIYFTKLFGKYVTLERSIDVLNPLDEVVQIKSKIQDYLIEYSVESIQKELINSLGSENEDDLTSENISIEELFIDMEQFKSLLGLHLKHFNKFIQVCHDLLISKKSFSKIQNDVELFFKSEQ